MEKNETTLTRIVINDLINKLRDAMMDKDDSKVDVLLDSLDEEYKYYKTLE